MNIRGRLIMQTHFLPYIPMPIGTKAIAPSIPDANYEPGCCSKRKCKEVPSTGLFPCPAKTIKQHENRVKDKEKNIKKFVTH